MRANRDLLQAQLYLMQHNELPFNQSEVQFDGHVIEARINAEGYNRLSTLTLNPCGKCNAFTLPGEGWNCFSGFSALIRASITCPSNCTSD